MTAAPRAVVVGGWAVRMWARELARTFRTTPRLIAVAAVVGLVVAVVVGGLLAALTGSQLGGGLPAELTRRILGTAFAGAAMIATAVAVVAAISMPAHTALESLLELLPVGRAVTRIGLLLPVCCAALAYAAVMTVTTPVVILALLPEPADLARALALHVLLLVVVEVLAVAGFLAIAAGLGRLLRLPRQYATVASAAIVIGGVLVVTGADILPADPSAEPLWGAAGYAPHRAIAALALGVAGVRELAVLAVWIAATVVAVLLTGVRARRAGVSSPITLLRRLPGPSTPRGALVRLELLAAVRTPQVIVVAAASLGALGLAWAASSGPPYDMLTPWLAGAAVTLPFFLSAYAAGRTSRMRWLSRLLGAADHAWIGPAAIASAVIGAAIAAPAFVLAVALGLTPLDDVPQLAARAAIALFAGLLGGALVPYSEEQPVAAAVTGFTVGIVYLAASLLVQGAVTLSGPDWAAPAATAVAGMLALGYAAVGRAQGSHALARV